MVQVICCNEKCKHNDKEKPMGRCKTFQIFISEHNECLTEESD